ncbi:hypothetical protein TWF694_010413 [Orbilia ellipsospora]|uniref:Uncharacterized protein n=1 Tax=Orbilia ellipsospora TaxID=2528407 RepID=A0AAV9X9T2_9PEZI
MNIQARPVPPKMQSASMSLPVYLIVSVGGGRQDHHAIFIETEERGPRTGDIYQVTGSMQNGMTFEYRSEDVAPEDSLNFMFLSKVHLGDIKREECDKVMEVCKGVAPPKKQFRGSKKLYPSEPLRACQEWVAEVVQVFREEGILRL